MNMEKTTERYPIRYYSMITVAKDFISQANGSLAEGTADWKAADKELEKLKKLSEKHNCYATVVNSLTPYIFLLLETEEGKPYWQYMEMAGALHMFHFTDEESWVEAEKIIYENGGYMYRIKEIYLQRKKRRKEKRIRHKEYRRQIREQKVE